jgi:membrane protein
MRGRPREFPDGRHRQFGKRNPARANDVAKPSSSWFDFTTLKAEPGSEPHNYLLRGWLVLSSAVESFINNDDFLRASALTYTVALSIVPILALAFSALKGFGQADALRPLVERYLAAGSESTANEIMSFVQNVNAAALGSIGGAFLLVTVISTMSTVEQALNTIFSVPQSRSYLRKFSDYLSVIFTGPIIIAAALGATAFLSGKLPYLTWLGVWLAAVVPYAIVWAGFFFLFIFFPYTRVHYVPALIGSFVTAILFQIVLWGYVQFQIGMAGYRAIYGALASVPIFLVWIYVAWAVILLGAEITAAVQRGADHAFLKPISPEFHYAAALHVLLRLAERFRNGGSPVTSWTLSRELAVTQASLEPIIASLKDAGVVVESEASARSGNSGLFLVHAPDSIVLADALADVVPPAARNDGDPRVHRVLEEINSLRMGFLKALTLEQLRSDSAPTAPAKE